MQAKFFMVADWRAASGWALAKRRFYAAQVGSVGEQRPDGTGYLNTATTYGEARRRQAAQPPRAELATAGVWRAYRKA